MLGDCCAGERAEALWMWRRQEKTVAGRESVESCISIWQQSRMCMVSVCGVADERRKNRWISASLTDFSM